MTRKPAAAPEHPTRREALVRGGLGALGLASSGRGTVSAPDLARDDAPGLTAGPFRVDEGRNRREVRPDPATGAVQPGPPPGLTPDLASLAAEGTAGARVGLRRANRSGNCPDEASRGTSGVGHPRGHQPSNAYGNVRPVATGPRRISHGHIRARVYDPATLTPPYNWTTQPFRDDAITDDDANAAPHNARGARDTTNARDGIFRGASADGTPASDAGPSTLMQLTRDRTRAAGSVPIILDLARASGSSPGGWPSGGTAPAGGTPPSGTPKQKATQSSVSSSTTKAGPKATKTS